MHVKVLAVPVLLERLSTLRAGPLDLTESTQRAGERRKRARSGA